MTLDELYFSEWDSRRPGEKRSLTRARALFEAIGLGSYVPRALTVVGSKGKGVTAVYASGYLVAAGYRVVTVTSPSYISLAERIRVDGSAISERTLSDLGNQLATAIRSLPQRRAGEGYLSPSGLFMLSGLMLARDLAADYVVLEAGRGGISDEVSIVEPSVVAVSAIFEEHLEELGGSLGAVVEDKCGVVRDSTSAVVVAPQPTSATERLIHEIVRARSGGRLTAEDVRPSVHSLPEHLLPPGLGRISASLGSRAANRLLDATLRLGPTHHSLQRVLGSVQLPGRLSTHRLPGDGAEIVVDAAVSRAGYVAAAGYALARWERIDRVLLSIPDSKDLAGAIEEFGSMPVTFVTVAASHLSYTRPLPSDWTVLRAEQVDHDYLAAAGERLLALGTISFIAHILRLVRAPTSVAFNDLAGSSSPGVSA